MSLRFFAPLATLCLVLLFTAAAPVCAQGQNVLDGKVVLPNGAPPPNPVKVTLLFRGRHIYETFTDLSGRFHFNGLSRGTYQLVAEGDDTMFLTTTVDVELTSIGSAPQAFTQNIQLRLKTGGGGGAGAPASVVSVEELDKDVPERAREMYRKGVKSAADNKPAQAVKQFEEALAAYPQFYSVTIALAEQYAKLQRYAEALDAYHKASKIKPDRAEPYVGIGVTLVNQKRYDEGIAMLRRIVEVDEKLAAPYLSLGYAEMMTGDYPTAEKHLLRAYELSKPPIAHIYLANVYEQLDEPAKAVEHLQSYLKENPQSQNAESVRGAIEKLRKKMKDKK